MNTEHPNVTASADLSKNACEEIENSIVEFANIRKAMLDHFEVCFGKEFSLFKTEELFCELRNGIHSLIDAMNNLHERLISLERKDPYAL